MAPHKVRDKLQKTRIDSKKLLTMAELLEQSGHQVKSLHRNQEVDGKIIGVTPTEILVDIGAKSEGIIAGHELTDAGDLVSSLTVGDSIKATVLYPENDAGQVVLSLRKLSLDTRWGELEEKKESDDEIEVGAVEANRGGLICEYMGIRGFVPASQLVRSGDNIADLIGKTITVRVIEVDRQSNRLILSQKMPDAKDIGQIAGLLAKINIGDRLSGIVTAVLPFGIFVEVEIKESKSQRVKESKKDDDGLGKLEGLVHISEISWEKVEDPAKYFKVGDKVDVMVVAKDDTVGRLNLSIKQLADDPFLELSKQYSKDQVVGGNVDRITPYGVFVALSGGVEGLIHISKIPPNIEYEIGQALECTVEAVDTKARRITLAPVVREKPILYR